MADNERDKSISDLMHRAEEKTAIVTNLEVGSDGRITVPKKVRERYEIEEGDWVDCALFLEQ